MTGLVDAAGPAQAGDQGRIGDHVGADPTADHPVDDGVGPAELFQVERIHFY